MDSEIAASQLEIERLHSEKEILEQQIDEAENVYNEMHNIVNSEREKYVFFFFFFQLEIFIFPELQHWSNI